MFLTDEEAKAAAALVPLGQTTVTETGQLAQYVGRVLGTAPHDAVGLVLGDPLSFVRRVLAAQYDRLLDDILKRRNVEQTQPVSPSVAIPLLRAAYDESRPELQKIWAELIAAAMDPDRAGRVRASFIKTVLAFDPLDAVVLRCVMERYPKADGNQIANHIQRTPNEVQVSLDNLVSERCVKRIPTDMMAVNLTIYGQELLRACSD